MSEPAGRPGPSGRPRPAGPAEPSRSAGQLPLFDPGPGPAPPPRGPWVRPAPVHDELHELARRLPERVCLGTSSWSFPGWEGLVYERVYPQTTLAREGLGAYAHQPLLRAVGLDRSFYGPVDRAALADYAAVVPEGFRFLAKAHELCTLARFPNHRRHGERRGRDNPQWLDVAYACEHVVQPFVEGLGAKAGVLLFQFSPQDEEWLGGRHGFPERLHRFLAALPVGPCYAVELRNHKLLTPAYVAALRDANALHCVSVHPRMPDVRTQARQVGVLDGPALVVRWMLTPRLSYELARRYYHPFDTLVDPDPIARAGIAWLVREMSARGRPSLVIVNNKAEGCAPRSIEALARAIVEG
jgi:uncharacterized protein YecE (DUF72 family)